MDTAATGAPDLDSAMATWFAQRDSAALDLALHAALPRAWRQASRALGPGADAEDAVQEALIQFVRCADRYDGSVSPGAWLGRLVQVAVATVRRSAQRRQRREAPLMHDPVEPAPSPAPDAAVLRQALAELPASSRQAIELHYFAGLSQAEAAAAMDVSENTLGVRLHRARERLRVLLSARGVALGVTGTVSALASLPAADLPAKLSALPGTLSGQVAAGALPAAHLPTNQFDQFWNTMATHPTAAASISLTLVSVLLLGGLQISGALTPTTRASEAPATVVPPPTVPLGPQDQAIMFKHYDLSDIVAAELKPSGLGRFRAEAPVVTTSAATVMAQLLAGSPAQGLADQAEIVKQGWVVGAPAEQHAAIRARLEARRNPTYILRVQQLEIPAPLLTDLLASDPIAWTPAGHGEAWWAVVDTSLNERLMTRAAQAGHSSVAEPQLVVRAGHTGVIGLEHAVPAHARLPGRRTDPSQAGVIDVGLRVAARLSSRAPDPGMRLQLLIETADILPVRAETVVSPSVRCWSAGADAVLQEKEAILLIDEPAPGIPQRVFLAQPESYPDKPRD